MRGQPVRKPSTMPRNHKCGRICTFHQAPHTRYIVHSGCREGRPSLAARGWRRVMGRGLPAPLLAKFVLAPNE